jgi:hypothetical protein
MNILQKETRKLKTFLTLDLQFLHSLFQLADLYVENIKNGFLIRVIRKCMLTRKQTRFQI